ncbi:hypothetical protein MSAN_01477300 [Mycena sanguinolenta]|uniref:Uncharacterized protein n=1 Tax=Mycena sanguinolenta TaxID=230812 RepID=A0A8H7D1F6_9AGAR|nr:hypothetical protein MSAN_01477300 [Mycena sanguinolenta]
MSRISSTCFPSSSVAAAPLILYFSDCSLSLWTILLTALVVVLRGLSAPLVFIARPDRPPTHPPPSPYPMSSLVSIRRLAHPVDQQMALLALDHAYADDGPGELYVQGRRNPNGRLEFKVGRPVRCRAATANTRSAQKTGIPWNGSFTAAYRIANSQKDSSICRFAPWEASWYATRARDATYAIASFTCSTISETSTPSCAS